MWHVDVHLSYRKCQQSSMSIQIFTTYIKSFFTFVHVNYMQHCVFGNCENVEWKVQAKSIRKEEVEMEWVVKFMDKMREEKKKSITNWWIQMLWLTSGRRRKIEIGKIKKKWKHWQMMLMSRVKNFIGNFFSFFLSSSHHFSIFIHKFIIMCRIVITRKEIKM